MRCSEQINDYCDISEAYCKMAKNRLSYSEKDRHKLEEELKKHSVSKTFSDRKMKGEHTGKYRKTGQTKPNTIVNQ